MNKQSKQAFIAIIGGGPAGLMAAEKLASQGVKVVIYDQMPSVGRKFLMAGRGGLNLTHSESLDKFKERYGASSAWLAPILDKFTPQDLVKWCGELGQETFVGSSGRIFPQELKASPLLRAWLQRLSGLGVTFKLRHRWIGWGKDDSLIFESGESVKADAVILALGGASWPRLGSDGSWTHHLAQKQIDITRWRPSNCGFVVQWSEIFKEKFAGQPLKPVTVSFGNTSMQGEAMLTEKGIEGGIIYALSAQIRETIERDGQATLSLDLRPHMSIEELIKRLALPRGSQSSSTYLRKVLGLSPLIIGLMRESLGTASLPTSPHLLAALIKDTKITLLSPFGLERAISTAGGIALHEIDANLMLKKIPGVFAIGEMLDWEAPTGGYLLQASFSMAVAVAKGVKSYLNL